MSQPPFGSYKVVTGDLKVALIAQCPLEALHCI